MADDPWANWKPTTNPTVRGNEAYQARRALSRGLSADPMSPGSTSQARAPPVRQTPGSTSNANAAPGPASQSARRPLPEQSFPGSIRGGPSRSGSGWQRSPPAGHLDRGWASRTGHEEPLTKPVVAGDIESASNAPLTQVQRHEMQNNRRSGRDEMHDRARQRLDEERHNLDSVKTSSRDNRRDRSRDRSRDRERDRDRDRARGERDRKRPRTDDDREDRRRTVRGRTRSRSRSRSRERHREYDRRDRRRDDERRDRRHNDDRDTRRDRRSASPVRSRHRDSNRDASKSRREESPERKNLDVQEKAERQSPNGQEESSEVKVNSSEPSRAVAEVGPTKPESTAAVVVIKRLHEGTTAIDMRTVLEDFGTVTYCRELPDVSPADALAFEAGFQSSEGAEKAVAGLDGVYADGCKLKANLLAPSIKQEEEQDTSAPQSDSKGLKLKGFASAVNQDNSLLNRLGAPVKQSRPAVNGKDMRNGKVPEELLRPYDGLLKRAGVDSLDKLRQLVRPGTIKEYIEMLCKEYPGEELLQGLTGRWALKERLEEWLGEKEPLRLEWEGFRES